MNELQAFKKNNKERRIKIAKANGYSSVEAYIAFLEGIIVGMGKKGKIHVVDILDASGSMNGGKYDNSRVGITTGITDLRDDVNTYSLIEFVQDDKIIKHFNLVAPSIAKNIRFYGANGRNTPLYRTVYDAITSLRSNPTVNKGDGILIKVYTDGINNAYSEYKDYLKAILKHVKNEGFTVTFVATDYDMRSIISDLDLDDSNTLAVKNDAQGFKEAFNTSMNATRTYASAYFAGEDVSTGFYKKSGKL